MKRKRFKSALAYILSIAMILTFTQTSVWALSDPTGSGTESDPFVYEVSTVQDITDATEAIRASDGGNYVISLQNNIEDCGGITLNKAGTITTILGNGYTLKLKGQDNCIDASNGAVINLGAADDSDTLIITRGYANDTPGAIMANKNGTVNMYEGVTIKDVQGNNYYGGGVSINSGIFHMYGGTIENCGIKGGSNCYGGGVGVYKGGQFIMDDGQIKDCYVISDYYSNNKWQTSNCAGGGVWVFGGASFVMNGGEITGCVAKGDTKDNPSAFGGGVAVPTSVNAYYANNGYGYLDSSFIMNDGKITGCESDAVGGGVSVGGAYINLPRICATEAEAAANPNEFGVYINGGEISENSAPSGGGMFLNWIRKPVQIDECTFEANEAEEGAGIMIYSYYTSAEISNCTFENNEAKDGNGGAIYILQNDSSNGTKIENTVITGNICNGSGGGISVIGKTQISSVDASTGNIICNNIAADGGSDINIYKYVSIKLPDAAGMNKKYLAEKPADNTNKIIDAWYKDYYEARYVDKAKEDRVVEEDYAELSVAENGEISLIAAGSISDKVTVSFDLNYDGATGAPEDQEIDSGETVEKPSNPTRTGYNFGGWYTDAECTTAYDFNTPVTEDITLYAKWNKNKKPVPVDKEYTVSYDSNGGTEYDKETYKEGETVKLDKVPVKDGYEFTGWYSDKECTKKVESIEVSKNVTVYAGWKVIEDDPDKPDDPVNPNPVPKEPVPEVFIDDHYAYVIGYPDKTVKPEGNITRAEVATIFFRLLNDETRDEYMSTENSFDDVADGAWYNKAVSTLANMGIVKGDENGKFNPNNPITRAEFAAIAARFDDDKTIAPMDFSDIDKHWAKDEIGISYENGWVNGYPDKTFRPDNYITRAEAMTLVNRVLHRVPESINDLDPEMVKWSDNSDTNIWYYLAVQEATNSHNYEIKENKYERWDGLRENKDWTVYQ